MKQFRKFRRDEEGTMTMEFVIVAPLLFIVNVKTLMSPKLPNFMH